MVADSIQPIQTSVEPIYPYLTAQNTRGIEEAQKAAETEKPQEVDPRQTAVSTEGLAFLLQVLIEMAKLETRGQVIDLFL